MALAPGTRLGAYEVVSLLGEGGMGQVYQARDTRLKRDVALKILPDAFASNPDRVARFQREAELLATLNHPNIASIYGIEQADGVRALVLELVEGPTLADRIAEGRIPVDEALRIANQIADALEAAHERGVIHRDLKPANIKLTADDKVKVLDFGLAKVLENPAAPAALSISPTLSVHATYAGVILGTAAYMSPEQARGKAVDKRTDIWAFGCVLFEMLTGKPPFTGEDVAEVLGAIIHKDIAWDRLPSNTPATVKMVLARCLEKDPKERMRDIGDVRLALSGHFGLDVSALGGIAARSRGRFVVRMLGLSVAFVVTIIATIFIDLYYRGIAEPPRTIRLSLLPSDPRLAFGNAIPAVSPDGRRVVTVVGVDGRASLWVRDLDSNGRLLAGTDGATAPFWSADGRSIGFFAGGKLKRIDAAGGPAITLCDAQGSGNNYGGAWSSENVILFATSSGIMRVSAAGGSVARVTSLDANAGVFAHRYPSFLPDCRHFLFNTANQNPEKNAVYVGDLSAVDTPRAILPATSAAVFAQPGYILFVRDRTLMAQPFNLTNSTSNGDAVPLVEDVDSSAVNGRSRFSISQTGVLVYSSGGTADPIEELTWLDRSGKALGSIGRRGHLQWAAIAPDGKTVAYDRADPNYDIWLHDVARGTETRFTFGPGANDFPVWSPDGSQLIFRDFQHGTVVQRSVRTSTQQVIDRAGDARRADDWSRDGKYIVEESGAAGVTGLRILWVLATGTSDTATPYLQAPHNHSFARISPNGRWLAYVSDETNREEIYLQTFPKPERKWQVSVTGGSHPVWRRDGKELFFISAEQKMTAVSVDGTSGQPTLGTPQTLFDVRLGRINNWYDVSPDGRFLVPLVIEPATLSPLSVILNWPTLLKK